MLNYMWSCFVISMCFCAAIIKCQSSSCTTPNGEKASCLPILRCPILIQAATSNDAIAMKFFNESICDEITSKVCCGTSGKFTRIPSTPKPLSEREKFNTFTKEEKRDYVLKGLVPTKTYCGRQHTDDYFYNGTETSVDEFPWLVYIVERNLEHDQNYYKRVESNCAGALISNRYVLSNDGCHFYAQIATDTINMILGLHHIHKEVSCIRTLFGIDDCTTPALRVVSSSWKYYNEILLFRLNNKIDYTDYIRPICLPLEDENIPGAGTIAMASGWSEEETVKEKNLKVKKRMKYELMNQEECENGNVFESPICGIPFENNTHYVCNGDRGGPLMYRLLDQNWFVLGLVDQTDIGSCDEAQPVTAIRLTRERVSWIIENIEP